MAPGTFASPLTGLGQKRFHSSDERENLSGEITHSKSGSAGSDNSLDAGGLQLSTKANAVA